MTRTTPRFDVASASIFLALCVSQPSAAQQKESVTNLAARSFSLGSDWIAYSRSEFTESDLELNCDNPDDAAFHAYTFSTGETERFRLAAQNLSSISGEWVAFSVLESEQGEDLNDDLDLDDAVVHTHNLATGETNNLGVVSQSVLSISGDSLAFTVSEFEQGEDLNGDGENDGDRVVHVHDLATAETTNVGLAGGYRLSGTTLAIAVFESDQNEDLNGDGDIKDSVLHAHSIGTGETTNFEVAVATPQFPFVAFRPMAGGDWLASWVSESRQGRDLNDDGDTSDVVVHVHASVTGDTTNLRIAAVPLLYHLHPDRWLPFAASEASQGQDLNDDEDTEDDVLHVYDLLTKETKNLGFAMRASWWLTSDNWVAFTMPEASQGQQDLNDDGDTEDEVLHVLDMATGSTRRVEGATGFASLLGDWVLFRVSESDQDRDLNGDGDRVDHVFHVQNLITLERRNLGLVGPGGLVLSDDWVAVEVEEDTDDLNGDDDTLDAVLHVHNLTTGETTNLGIASSANMLTSWQNTGDWLAFAASEAAQGEDFNRDGDTDDDVGQLVDLSQEAGRQVPGDCNQDGGVDISDAVCVFGVLFTGQPSAFPCGDGSSGDLGNLRLIDWQGDGTIDVSDGISALQSLFGQGSQHTRGCACMPVAGCPTACP